MRFFFCLVTVFFSVLGFSQKYPIAAIPDSLLNHAEAVIRLDTMTVTVRGHRLMSVDHTRVVTVLNEAGQRHVNAIAFYDNDQKINQLNAIIFDALGNQVEKLRERDFLDQSASGDGTLYSDNRVKFMRYTPVTYPYTVVFENSYTTSDTAFLPRWYFMDDYNVSTEKSCLVMQIPSTIPARYKEHKLEAYEIQRQSTENQYVYTALNLTALRKEPFSPSFKEISPNVKFALEKFHLKGVDGQARNWQEFGLWINNALLEGQGELDESSKAQIRQLVQGIEDPKEKVKKVYEFLQNNTRYISVQLGIGGWKPISALDVGKVKYGDCKGLTNYTMALLNAVGIRSYYTVLHAGDEKRDLDPDFAALSGNHVFLNVPLEEEELWLECTSQDVPVNHLGTFSDDRYVLKITQDGGELVKSKSYTPKQSKQSTKAYLEIDEEANVSATVAISSTGIQYDQKYRLPLMRNQELEEHYKNYWDYVNNLKLVSVSFENNKKNIELLEKVTVSSENYISIAGDKWLFTPNMFNRNLFVPKRVRQRTQTVEIKRGYLDEDEFIITLPQNVRAEQLLPKVELKTDFGEYSLEMEKISENQIQYRRKLLVFPGTFEKERYAELRAFRKQVARNDNAKIVLIKT